MPAAKIKKKTTADFSEINFLQVNKINKRNKRHENKITCPVNTATNPQK